jgi:GT2 family glycosyltransferase
VVNFRRVDLLRKCLASLRAEIEAAHEIVDAELIVVDNGSGDESTEIVRREFPEVVLVPLDENLGFPAAVNEGLARSGGEWVLLLNNDATIERGAIDRLIRAGRSASDLGSVAAQMRFAGNARIINSAGIGVDALGIAHDRLLGLPAEESETQPTEVFGACAGAAIYRRAMLEQLGGLDATFFFALDDADLSWRAQMAGWRCLYEPGAVVIHHHGGTIRHESDFKYFHVGRNRVRMLAKNAGLRQLVLWGPLMIAYDLAYVLFALVMDRTVAPVRGRIAGLREWPRYRRAGAAGRRPLRMQRPRGLRAALDRRAAWRRGGSGRGA